MGVNRLRYGGLLSSFWNRPRRDYVEKALGRLFLPVREPTNVLLWASLRTLCVWNRCLSGRSSTTGQRCGGQGRGGKRPTSLCQADGEARFSAGRSLA